MKKNIFGIVTLVTLSAVVIIGYKFGFSWEQASANPDYICVKTVTDAWCKVDKCEDWNNTGERICTWKKVTELWYYHTRTACEAGYGVKITWDTWTNKSASTKAVRSALDSSWKNATTSHPSSWRHSSDFTYSSTTCTITEQDNEPPVWVIQ